MENLIFVILGAFFSLIVQIIYENYWQVNKNTKLFIDWHSTWQPTVMEGFGWVQDKIKIRRSIWGIKLTNDRELSGYKWEGRAKLINQTHLVGEWRSLNPGAHTNGIFALTFSTEGECLLGYFMAKDVDRGKIATGFVLGRTPENVEVCKKRLESISNLKPK